MIGCSWIQLGHLHLRCAFRILFEVKPAAHKIYLLGAILITLLGFGIRLYNLGGDSLWIDEQLTLKTANLNYPEILTDARDHPPLIYILTSFSIRQFGENEFSARLASMFAGTLAIPLLILFGKVSRRPIVGLWAGLFLAFSPFHLKYAQESRHYALLLLVSLATTIILYLALAKPTFWRWMGYGVLTALNLYVHYGAFIVLASQIVLIACWMAWQVFRRRIRNIRYPFLAGAVTFVLYLPWLPNFLASLQYNVGEETVSDTGSIAPMGEWFREAFYKFGMYFEYLPYLMFILAVLGLLLLLWQKDFLLLGILLSSILLPFIFIQLGNIARGSFVRYIIYVLPLYLFAAAISPATLVHSLLKETRRTAAIAVSVMGALLFVFLAWHPVQSEHEHIQDDWRGIVQYLDQQAEDGDIILGWSKHFANGFNTVAISFPYYLHRHTDKTLHLLSANRFDRDSMVQLRESEGQIWIVLYDREFDWQQMESIGYAPQHFQSRLYILPGRETAGTTLERLIAEYETLIPLADPPSPRCLLQKDLALLHAEAGDYETAEHLLFDALDACPDRLSGDFVKYTLEEDVLKVVFQGAVSAYLAQGNLSDARRVAGKLYGYDPKNEIGLAALTEFDLLDLYKRGEAKVDDARSLEPVRVTEFIMPDSGDGGQALFVHPPSSVTFQVSLPEEPTRFVSRVALDPQSWDWGGDGSTFILSIRDEDGEYFELARQHIGNGSEERRWYPMEAALDPFAGQTVEISLRSDPGPNGDFSADWAGWETPRILAQP